MGFPDFNLNGQFLTSVKQIDLIGVVKAFIVLDHNFACELDHDLVLFNLTFATKLALVDSHRFLGSKLVLFLREARCHLTHLNQN